MNSDQSLLNPFQSVRLLFLSLCSSSFGYDIFRKPFKLNSKSLIASSGTLIYNLISFFDKNSI